MTRSDSSVGTSLALVAAVAAVAVTAAVVLVPRTDSSHAAQTAHANNNAVYVVLPPPPAEAVSTAATGESIATAEPFEPPAPPMIAAVPSPAMPAPTVAAAVPARHSRGVQVAALSPPGASDLTPVDVPPPLRAIERENRHAAVRHDEPERRANVAEREHDAISTVEHAPPKHTAAARNRGDAGDTANAAATGDTGAKVDGPAIVTGPLELNVAGTPLRLYGVKAPSSGDMCAPNPEYAARSCPDVSRAALAARIGQGGKVSCRILASGGRQALPVVCKDGTGTDLANYLVAHGFALAEANDMMIDYSAAETQAKNAHSGLWSDR